MSFTTAYLTLLIGSAFPSALGTSLPQPTRSGTGGPYHFNNDSQTITPARPSSSAAVQTASNYGAAVKCWNEWDSYSGWLTSCPKTTITGSVYTLSDQWTYTEYKTSKLCDAHPRAVAHGGWRTSYSTESEITYPFQTISLTTITYDSPPSRIPIPIVTTTDAGPVTDLTVTRATPAPQPRCTIDNKNCQSLFSAWTAGGFTQSKPPRYYPEPGDPCDACVLFVPSVKLLYFLVSMTGDCCGNNCT